MVMAASAAATPAFAQISVNINIAPPAPMYEVTPVMASGYIWVPGYWAWNVDRHVWIRGRTIVQRVGYRWETDRWEQRDHGYYRHPGRWQPDASFKAVKMKKEKMPKHWDKRDDGGKSGNGNGGKHGKGHKQND